MGGSCRPSPPRRRDGSARDPGRAPVGIWRWIIAGLMVCWVFLGQAQAQVKGLIVGPGAERYRLAVSPLRNLGTGADVPSAFRPDCRCHRGTTSDRSGWFKIIDRSAYIENPQRTGIRLGDFDFRDWATIGAEGLVKGGFRHQGDRVPVRVLALRRVPPGIGHRQAVLGRHQGRASHGAQVRGRDHPEADRHSGGIRYQDRIRTCPPAGTGSRRFTFRTSTGPRRRRSPTTGPSIFSRPGRRTARGWSTRRTRRASPHFLSFDLVANREKPISTRAGLNLGGALVTGRTVSGHPAGTASERRPLPAERRGAAW